jgi:Domain of unknown function (DUF4340)
MRAPSFLILAGVTLLVTVAAGVAVVRKENPRTTIETGGAVLPGLVDRLADVTAIVIRESGNSLTVRRIESGWGVAERNDYPVPPDRVRELVRSMVQLERSEAKTVRPERYARLGVEDVDTPNSKSKEIVLQTTTGTPVAKLIVGTAASGFGADGGTYVRIPGDPQAWLARGALAPSLEPRDWIERRLIEIPVADIRQVKIVQPGGATLTAVRDSSDSANFRLAELPAGGKLARPDAVDALVQPFGELAIEDLEPRDKRPFPKDKTMRITVTRMDGSTVGFEVVEDDGRHWLRFTEGASPTNVPAAGRAMAFRVPSWKITPLERKFSELVETRSGS